MDTPATTDLREASTTDLQDTNEPSIAPERPSTGMNVAQIGRVVAGVIGGALLLRGLTHRSLGGVLMAVAGGDLLRQVITGNSFIGRRLGITSDGELTEAALEVQRTSTIRKSPEELYRLWRDPSTLPLIMEEFAEVRVLDENHTHWVLKAPLTMTAQWDSEIIEDRPNELIRWRSQPGADITNEGSIEFRTSGERGTEVVMRLRYAPPLGVVGQRASRLLRIIPRGLELRALRNFKCLAETGEVTTVKGQSACRNDGRDM